MGSVVMAGEIRLSVKSNVLEMDVIVAAGGGGSLLFPPTLPLPPGNLCLILALSHRLK